MSNKKEPTIMYVKGDATEPQGDGRKIICHICNDVGGWGAGFVLALSAKWKLPEQSYRALFNPNVPAEDRTLGRVRMVYVEDDIMVANMIGQSGIKWVGNLPPIRYDAVRKALTSVNAFADEHGCTLHAPMFGTGLAGGEWEEIEKIINEVVTVPITIYVLNEKDLPQNSS